LGDDRLVEPQLPLDLRLRLRFTKPAESKMMSVMLPGTRRSITKIRTEIPNSVSSIRRKRRTT
jgi:hypothetical protein